MISRRSDIFLIFFCTLLISLSACAVHAFIAEKDYQEPLRLVKRFDLTDIVIALDARYIRNLAITDIYSPFLEHPCALDHFPSGAIFKPLRESFDLER